MCAALSLPLQLHGLCGIPASEKHAQLGRNSPEAWCCSSVSRWMSLPGGAGFEANCWGEAVHTGVFAGTSVLKGKLLCSTR